MLSSDAFIMAVDATTMGRHLNFSKQEENVDCRVPFNSIAPDWGADVREFSGMLEATEFWRCWQVSN